MNIALSKFKRVALDSNIFIYYFEANPEFGPTSKKLVDSLSAKNITGVTSIISLLELLSKKGLPKNIARQLEEDFFEIPNLTVSELTREITVATAGIRRKYGFRLSDSIQLATAKLNKAQAFVTNDRRLKGFKELPVILLS